MTDKDHFDWIASEAYPAPEFTDAERQECSDILEAVAEALGLTPYQLEADIQRLVDQKLPKETEQDQADWWKGDCHS